MTVFENIKSMNIDEFTEWYAKNCIHDNDPAIKWWDKTYCNNCDGIYQDKNEYAYCELHGKCRYFQNMDEIPDIKQSIKLWLESESKQNE